MPRPRCPECGRITIVDERIGDSDEPADTFMVAPLEPHMGLLLKAAQEFDAGTPDGESYTATDFVDVLALSVAREYKIPAGKPAGKRRAA